MKSFLITAILVGFATLATDGFLHLLKKNQKILLGSTTHLHTIPRYQSSFQDDIKDRRRVSVLLKISYDASRFCFSAGNDVTTKATSTTRTTHPPQSSQRRRNRRIHSADNNSAIRSVQKVLQLAISQLYGKIDPNLVVVEGASRTDLGVHAFANVVQIYALVHNYSHFDDPVFLDGKRLPHPRNDTDPSGVFVSLPMTTEKLAFSLNRMLPPDVRVIAYAPLPLYPQIFHASVSAIGKTYAYRLAIGKRSDPTQRHCSFYVGDLSWNQETVSQVIELFTLQAHNFTAFRGAPRGKDDKHKWQKNQNTICRLDNITVSVKEPDYDWDPTHITITIAGDRFVYKMVRFLVGTLLGAATGALTLDQVQRMLVTGQRPNNTVLCAPAHGLVLEEIHYSPALKWTPANS
jgi:tRNA pseudouridine38-40 synthase